MNRVSTNTINKVKLLEGWRSTAYRDSAGHWTIGYGHADTLGIAPIPRKGMKITKSGGERILATDLAYFNEQINRLVKVKLPSDVYGGFFLLAYNIGIPAFSKSTALRRLNAGDTLGAARALLRFNKSRNPDTHQLEVNPGLVTRRQFEYDMIMAAMDVASPSVVHIPKNAQGGEAKPLVKSKTNWLGGVIAAGGAAGASAQSNLNWITPYVPQNLISYILIAVSVAGVLVMVNRAYDSFKGVH